MQFIPNKIASNSHNPNTRCIPSLHRTTVERWVSKHWTPPTTDHCWLFAASAWPTTATTRALCRQEMMMLLCVSDRYAHKMHVWFESPVGGRLWDAKYCCEPIYGSGYDCCSQPNKAQEYMGTNIEKLQAIR
jgi:hypothetical protein